MSLVPARMTTTFGLRSRTSCRNRTSICGVVWPLMPRPTYGLPVKKPPKRGLRPRVGDRVAHEDDARVARRRRGHGPVRVAIARQVRPVARAAWTSAFRADRELGTARHGRGRRRRLLGRHRHDREQPIRTASFVRIESILSSVTGGPVPGRHRQAFGVRSLEETADPEREHQHAAADGVTASRPERENSTATATKLRRAARNASPTDTLCTVVATAES